MLEEGIELANGMVASLLVGKPYDASFLWDGVKDVKDIFFADHTKVVNKTSFARWFQAGVDHVCIAMINGEPAACAYIVGLELGCMATYHAFAFPKYRRPLITIPLAHRALEYFIGHFGLKKIETVGLMSNRVARLTAVKLGFRIERIIRKHQRQSGRLVDCFVGAIRIM